VFFMGWNVGFARATAWHTEFQLLHDLINLPAQKLQAGRNKWIAMGLYPVSFCQTDRAQTVTLISLRYESLI